MNRISSLYQTGLAPAPCYVFAAAQTPVILAGQILSVVAQPMIASTVSSSLRGESIKYVEGLESLRDDWDGYGGYAPSKLVCDHATRLIKSLAAAYPDLSSPDISPNANGTVQLSWEADKGEAIIEIGDFRFSGYIKRAGSFAPLVGDAQDLGNNELSTIAGCLA